MLTVYVLGGGTLGRFVADIAAARADLTVGGFFDDRYPDIRLIDGVPVIGRFDDADPVRHQQLVIGVADPRTRQRLHEQARSAGFIVPAIVHPSAVISPSASISDGVIIGPFATVLSGSRIGTGCCLLSQVNINHDTIVHPWCLIGAAVAVGNGATLEEGCHIGMGQIIRPGTTVASWSYSV